MPLLDNFMLPKRVREMAQMADLLQAEQLMFDRVYKVLQELLAQGSINNNIVLTKAELERIVGLFTGCECRVDEFAGELTIHICVKRNSGRALSIRGLVGNIKALIPAHLKYVIVPELQAGVNIRAKKYGGKIRYDFSGERYCGELPRIARLGKINIDELQIKLEAAGRIFAPPTAKGMGGGTSGQAGAMIPAVAAAGFGFAADYCGEGYAGEEGY